MKTIIADFSRYRWKQYPRQIEVDYEIRACRYRNDINTV